MIAKNRFDLLLAVNWVKVTQLWCNSNSTCRATYWMYIPRFELISQSMLKKSPENADGRTDGGTDGRTLPRHNTSRFSNGRKKNYPIQLIKELHNTHQPYIVKMKLSTVDPQFCGKLMCYSAYTITTHRKQTCTNILFQLKSSGLQTISFIREHWLWILSLFHQLLPRDLPGASFTNMV